MCHWLVVPVNEMPMKYSSGAHAHLLPGQRCQWSHPPNRQCLRLRDVYHNHSWGNNLKMHSPRRNPSKGHWLAMGRMAHTHQTCKSHLVLLLHLTLHLTRTYLQSRHQNHHPIGRWNCLAVLRLGLTFQDLLRLNSLILLCLLCLLPWSLGAVSHGEDSH